MKSPDSGNQRTGHPRGAQVIANTWNVSAPRRRPQHGTFAVSPSHAWTKGLRKIASRVWLSGNALSGPSGIHACSAMRRTGPRIEPTIGMAKSAAATAFTARPSAKRKPRRDIGPIACGMVGVGSAIGALIVRVRLARERATLAREPRDHVGDLLRGERLPAILAAPIGHAERGPADEHRRAEPLIAHERQVRAIDDRAAVLPAGAGRAVARGAPGGVHLRAARGIAGRTGVRRRRRAGEGVGATPARTHLAHD